MPEVTAEPAPRPCSGRPERESKGAQPTEAASRTGPSDAGLLLLPLVFVIVALAAALSFDIVRTGYGVKGNEATYVPMGLSFVHDWDLAYKRAGPDPVAPVASSARVRAGGAVREISLEADRPVSLSPEPSGQAARYGFAYLLEVETARGFVPRLIEPLSRDVRFLGVQLQLQTNLAAPAADSPNGPTR